MLLAMVVLEFLAGAVVVFMVCRALASRLATEGKEMTRKESCLFVEVGGAEVMP
jgi:single-stranded DNA-specific DHH superfamily exonuclease